jgi:hypothetical protein
MGSDLGSDPFSEPAARRDPFVSGDSEVADCAPAGGADAIGVYFAPEGAEYVESEEVAPGVTLDFDAQGRVIGVEILYVRDLLARGSTQRPTAENPAAE